MATKRTILIVDDDAELRDALVEQLALHEEFDAISADSGTKGVQAAKNGQVDLVIMRDRSTTTDSPPMVLPRQSGNFAAFSL